MNASKNCSDSYPGNSLFKYVKRYFLITLLLVFCFNVSAGDQFTNSSNVVDATDYFKVLLGLVFVIALFLASTFLFKRFGNGPMPGRGQLRIIDGLHLGSRERLMLIELKGKQILLAITPGRINKLASVDVLSSEEVSSDPALEVVHPSSPGSQLQAEEVTDG